MSDDISHLELRGAVLLDFALLAQRPLETILWSPVSISPCVVFCC